MRKKSEEKIDRVMGYFTEQKYLIKGLEKCIDKQQNRINNLEIENGSLRKQLQCAAKGHNFVFDNVEYFYWVSTNTNITRENAHKFYFKCSNCNLTITKTKDELTPKEKKALIDLKILEENNAKTTKTKTTN